MYTRRLLTKCFGFKDPVSAFGSSGKSCGPDINVVLGVWIQVFQKDALLRAIYSNI